MEDQGKAASNRFVIIGAASVIVIIVFLAYVGMQQDDDEPTVPSTEWTAAPEGGVEVDLPETPMRNVPVEPESDPAEETAEPSEEQ